MVLPVFNTTPDSGLSLDQALGYIAAMGVTNCTATGVNTITLAPAANQPAVGTYVNNARFDFVATGNSSGTVTLQVGVLTLLPLYKPGGSQAGSGDVVSGAYYAVIFLQALNGGLGGFQIASAIPASAIAPVGLGGVKGLVLSNNASTPNTKITISFSQAVLVSSVGTPFFTTVSPQVIDLTTTGAGGMDTGARPTSNWVYCYLISTGSGANTLATQNPPSTGGPGLPGGYSYFVYVGAMFCDGSQNLLRTKQLGRDTQYTVTSATNTANLPAMASGTVGSISVPTWVAVGVSPFVPATAGKIKLAVHADQANCNVMLAPNNNYGPTVSTTNPPYYGIVGSTSAHALPTVEMVLESTNVYWASNANASMWAAGWTDYYVQA